MALSRDLVTVFRTAGPAGEDDASTVYDLLEDAGLSPALIDAEAPDSAFEVRVPPGQVEAAAKIIANPPEPMPPDASHDMDLETVFRAFGTTAEMEAMAIRSVLTASGIPSVLMGTPQYPVLPFFVKVPKSAAVMARQVLADARAAGPAAAEEAERAGEESI